MHGNVIVIVAESDSIYAKTPSGRIAPIVMSEELQCVINKVL